MTVDLSNPCLVLKQSVIHGMGVFASSPIKAGAAVIRLGGVVIPGSDVVEGMRVMQIGPDLYLAQGPKNDDVGDYINHSCEPNLGFLDGSLVLYALRDIGPEQEVFWDYSTSMNEPGWRVPCRCGTPSCRGWICSFCDLSQSDRQKLQPLTLQYLRS